MHNDEITSGNDGAERSGCQYIQ